MRLNVFQSATRLCVAFVFVVLAFPGSRLCAVDFSADIEPILHEHCVDCHGPDEQSSQFRLDRLANMLAGGNSGEPAIVPGDPAASYLFKLIQHEEPGWEMPPDDSLSKSEIQLIETWITEGAKTPKSYGAATANVKLTHWSFQPVVRPTSATGIDDLIRQQLKENGLTASLSPRADRRLLIRRLYLVMLGIPPTPKQVSEFLAEDREDAWQRLVEQVLASPQYGQRWASHWLDLVRFGETDGFETNRERPNAWQYRDWVIDAFNQDKPYDQFVREQLAGDALNADVATSFLVAGPHDIVKGKDPKLGQIQRMNELDDMINTTGTAFLGLTTGCARCHSHKFDPISQRDYYAMQALFAGVQHGERPMPLSEDANRSVGKLDREIADLTLQLQRFLPGAVTASNREGTDSDLIAKPILRPAVNATKNDESFPPREVRFVRFTIDATSGGQACVDELEVFSKDRNVALRSEGAKASSSGDFKHPLHNLKQIHDGQYGNPHSWISESVKDGWVQIELAKPAVIDRIVWSRDREGQYADRLATRYRIEAAMEIGDWDLIASSADRKQGVAGKSIDEQYRFDSFSPEEAKQGRQWLDRLKSARESKTEWMKSTLVYAGQFSQPGPTHRLYRGEPGAPRERVGPDTIQVFGSLSLDRDAADQDRRLAFANWVTRKDNPLTPRVIVNRLWQFHFGTGIVDTPSDFGNNGTPPSHPELLDWLADELINNDWSLKHLHQLILNSNTWQQSSRPQQDAIRIDATSRLLWRFPPRRCEAETIRDSILAVSGALDLEKSSGPGFSAFAVDLENVRHYHPKEEYGPDDWRRMIYMTKVRQEKDQVFGAFDCPDASMVVPKRSRSTTPIQALNLLNSRFVMQQAAIFSTRLQEERDSTSDQIVRAWQLCFGRPPSKEELSDSTEFIQQEGLVQFARAMLNANEFVFIP